MHVDLQMHRHEAVSCTTYTGSVCKRETVTFKQSDSSEFLDKLFLERLFLDRLFLERLITFRS